METGLPFTPIEAHSLTTGELQQHLTLLKSQPEQPSPEEHFQTCQEI
jgi:hypothetical protein